MFKKSMVSCLVGLVILFYSVSGDAYLFKVEAWKGDKADKWIFTGCDNHYLGTHDENRKQLSYVKENILNSFEKGKRKLKILNESPLFYVSKELTLKALDEMTGDKSQEGQTSWIDLDIIREVYRAKEPYKYVSVEAIDPRLVLGIWREHDVPDREEHWRNTHIMTLLRTGRKHLAMSEFIEGNPGNPLTIELKKFEKRLDSDVSLVKAKFKTCLENSSRFGDISKKCKELDVDPAEDFLGFSISELISEGVNEKDLRELANFIKEDALFIGALDWIALWEVANPSAENFNFVLVGADHCRDLAPSFKALGYSKVIESKDSIEMLKTAKDGEYEKGVWKPLPKGLKKEINATLDKIGLLAQ